MDYITLVTKQQLSWTAFITWLNLDCRWENNASYMAILMSAYYELYNKYLQMNASCFNSIQLFRWIDNWIYMTTCEYKCPELLLTASYSSGSQHPFTITSTSAVGNKQIKPQTAGVLTTTAVLFHDSRNKKIILRISVVI